MRRSLIPFSVLAALAPLPLGAQATTDYLLVKDLPFVGATTDIASYLQGIFNLGMGLAVTLAILMIVVNGIKYMVSDAIGEKIAAKDIIKNALVGLLIIFGSVIILNTINPQLTSFNLQATIKRTIDAINSRQPGGADYVPPTGGGGGGTGTCTNCVNMPAGVTCKNASSCTIAAEMAPKLAALANNLRGENWQVTEGYPPTQNHAAECHRTGTCIDANFTTDKESPSAERIKNFITAASKAGLGACYEVSSQARYDELIQAGVPASNLLRWSAITAPHFSVYSHKSGC